jgi:N-carbamoyl-L-amino-acid hydrolase
MGASVPDHFEAMWRAIEPLGRAERSGGYFRQPFDSAERELDAWFVEQATARALRIQTDPFGNRIAWWDSEGVSLPGVVTGSHLDSVLEGGAFDGPLGVVTGLAAVDVLRERGFRPARPIGVSVFVEEEGSRFGRACLGSRLATGAVTWDKARDLRDRSGVSLAEAMASVGLATENPQPWLGSEHIGCFVELHVEQGRDLVDRGAAVGVASRIWPHGRYRFDITGAPNHAGTTRMEDRQDPMLTYAMTALAANKQARVAGQRATFGRVETRPNSTNSVPSSVVAWMDARCETVEKLAELVATVTRQAEERADRDGTRLTVTAESVSGAVDFDPDLAHRIAADHETGDWPILPTAAGHDAGILAAQGIASAMLFVRNPTGVSHSPVEHAELPDCLAGIDALAETLERLAS